MLPVRWEHRQQKRVVRGVTLTVLPERWEHRQRESLAAGVAHGAPGAMGAPSAGGYDQIKVLELSVGQIAKANSIS